MSSTTDSHPRVSTGNPTYTPTRSESRSVVGEYWELTKPRLSMLSVITAVVGYLAADPSRDFMALGAVLLGTSFAAGAAGALNQFLERDADAKMARTRGRPLPSGAVTPQGTLIYGLLLGALGTGLLWAGANSLSATLVMATMVSYLLIYTPLKRLSAWNTIVGAVPGALPPLVGWAAAQGSLGTLGWLLFGILFCWQIPHFMAIAWNYRKDYAQGGFVMATLTDPTGRSAGMQSTLFAAVLIAFSLAPVFMGFNTWAYGAVAILAGAWYLQLSVKFWRAESKDKPAKKLFLASIAYLPVVLAVFVVDRLFLV